jgi:hypothetical protein
MEAKRVSRLCFKNMRFSFFAHAILSSRTRICVGVLFGMAPKWLRSVRTEYTQ